MGFQVNDTVTYLERVKQDQPRLTQVAKENLQNDTVLAYGKVDEFLKVDNLI